uniref:glioma pathogenesis-related protein 1-like isoform X2 n=1 Tax=Ciona intestinalis TaxID=7719 RepID=UPI000EF4E891|nr:glioma pathogenesis-related protein 1-like isoform X2 [Ciona intestinalis]|eukprot:XP_026693715.1 glioma pathogenesis-related protein 1-like isoform X2 [Ciona intestinalis]
MLDKSCFKTIPKSCLVLFSSLVCLFVILYHNNYSAVHWLLSRHRRASDNHLITLILSDAHHDDFVKKHNELRRIVSPNASNMMMMSWDNELQALAEEYTKSCNFAHSSGLHTSVFSSVGENIRKVGTNVNTDLLPNETTQAWYDEVSYYNYHSLSCQAGKECGHYKQVVWAESYKVGCGVSVCRNVFGTDNGLIVSCNYGERGGNVRVQLSDGSIIQKQPYKTGAICSECAVEDTCKDSLCTNPARDPVKESPETTTHILIETTNTDSFKTTTAVNGVEITTMGSFKATSPPKTTAEVACDLTLCGGATVAISCTNETGGYTCICKTSFEFLQTDQTKTCVYNLSSTINPSRINNFLLVLIWVLAFLLN